MAQIDDLEQRFQELEAEFNLLMQKPHKTSADYERLIEIANKALDIQSICKEHGS